MNSVDSKIKTPFILRGMLKRDLKTICDIEDDIFEFPWTYDQFQKKTKTANIVCSTIEVKEQIAGYVVYKSEEGVLVIEKLGIAREFQRQFIGTTFINAIKNKMEKIKVKKITCSVHCNILPAQLFLKKNGFKCYSTYELEDGEHYAFIFGELYKEE
jgi:ribosomal-protein-alanine N-acetyltransferase